MRSQRQFTLAHITHEAVEKIGGIGTVLEGMMTSATYRSAVGRSILVGPMGGHHFQSPMRRLGEQATVHYSSIDGIDMHGWGRKFHPIERAFDARIAYGTRHYQFDGKSGSAEVLLIDISNPNQQPLNEFKTRLWRRFGIDAARFQADWGFEEYCRIAEPAFYALSALLDEDELPCIIISHEFMGMCTAFKAVLDGGDAFRTILHAHECSTARRLVEGHPGHDTAFYNVMKLAESDGLYVEDVFGSQNGHMRHALISQAHHLDGIIAVGDPTADELRFLSNEMAGTDIDLVYNGIPSFPVDLESKRYSRSLVDDWAEKVMGLRPDVLMTHVTRPVISKGMWRDLKVAGYMEPILADRKMTGLLIILTCGAPPRSTEDVNRMAGEYGWPRHHRQGYPDLVGPEISLNEMIEPFNSSHSRIQVVLVNQFGWSRERIGDAAAPEMDLADLRRATDVEFGQSTYEPFGIAQLEPLGSGAICVPSSVCGCVASFRHAVKHAQASEADYPNVLVADYTQLDGDQGGQDIPALLAMTSEQRSQIEERVAQSIAQQLVNRLPRNDDDRSRLIRSGQKLCAQMGWDQIMQEGMLPLFERVVNHAQHD